MAKTNLVPCRDLALSFCRSRVPRPGITALSSMAAVLAVFTVTLAPMSAAVANDKDPSPTALCGQWMNNPIFDETILFGGR